MGDCAAAAAAAAAAAKSARSKRIWKEVGMMRGKQQDTSRAPGQRRRHLGRMNALNGLTGGADWTALDLE